MAALKLGYVWGWRCSRPPPPKTSSGFRRVTHSTKWSVSVEVTRSAQEKRHSTTTSSALPICWFWLLLSQRENKSGACVCKQPCHSAKPHFSPHPPPIPCRRRRSMQCYALRPVLKAGRRAGGLVCRAEATSECDVPMISPRFEDMSAGP